MRISKKSVLIFCLLILFGFLSLFEQQISGNVIINSIIEVNNCSEETIKNIWDEFFDESSEGISILRKIFVNGVCSESIALKFNSGNEFWYLIIEENKDYGLNSSRVFGIYSNISDSFLMEIQNIENYSEAFNLWENIEERLIEVSNWSVETSEVIDKFSNYSDVVPSGELFYYPDLVEGNEGWSFSLNEEVEFVDELLVGGILENKSFVFVDYNYNNSENYDPPYLTSKKKIENYTFEMNSSWNYAFNISEYFDYYSGLGGGDVYFEFSYIGENNSLGSWINSTITLGIVNFRPAKGFIGLRNFRIRSYILKGLDKVYLGESNNFSVLIVEEINRRPILKKDIENVNVPLGGIVEVWMDYYFEDPDRENLSFRTTEIENVTITFEGDKMSVSLKEGFLGYEKLRIYASDGGLEQLSNEFYIFDDRGEEILGLDLLNKSFDDNRSSLTIDSVVQELVEEEGFEGGFDWWFFVVVSLVCLIVIGIIIVLIYYFILNRNDDSKVFISSQRPVLPLNSSMQENLQKGEENVSDPSLTTPISPQTKVQDYIKGLNLKKE